MRQRSLIGEVTLPRWQFAQRGFNVPTNLDRVDIAEDRDNPILSRHMITQKRAAVPDLETADTGFTAQCRAMEGRAGKDLLAGLAQSAGQWVLELLANAGDLPLLHQCKLAYWQRGMADDIGDHVQREALVAR
jgi:hypothetical protein